VEREDGEPSAAFLVPFRRRGAMTAPKLAAAFLRFRQERDPNLRGALAPKATDERAGVTFTTALGDIPLEGKYCAVTAAGGSMGFVVGVMARQGKLAGELALLQQVARSFRFTLPRGQWADYRSPGNGFTLALPKGWQVESTEGKIAKNEIDWWAFDPARPLARAFSSTPKFCSADLAQHPLYQLRRYKVAVFQTPEQCLAASLGELLAGARLRSSRVDAFLTALMQKANAVAIQSIASLGTGRLDIAVYAGTGEAAIQGAPVRISFHAMVSQLVMAGGFTAATVQTDVLLKGWFAPPAEFVGASPVLERIESSMMYTPEYMRMVYQAEAERARVVQETWRQVNQISKEIWQKHWDTQDAIAEMWYDHWRSMDGYVNEKTGRIEQVDPDRVVRNSGGDVVSREEVQAGTPADQATVLRTAGADDYMRGAYGRIEFYDF
jgi:hypothetical protein